MKRTFIISAISLATVGCSHTATPDATGTFEATEVTVSAEAAGRILSFDIEEGDTVVADRPIGAIDSVQLYLSKMQLLRNGRSVSAMRPDIHKQIAATTEQLNKQLTERQRTENLLRAGAATTKQLDDINAAIGVLESQLTAQRATLSNSAASIDAQRSAIDMQIAQIDDRLSKCTLRSPVGGTVLGKYVERGELATLGRPLFRVADLNRVYLRAYVTSEQLSKLKVGDSVHVTAQFGGQAQRTYPGRISWIAQQSEFTPKNIQTVDDRADMVYAIKIAVHNDGLIKIGTYGEVKF